MLVLALFEAELSESSMGGNPCGQSTGETLSRWQDRPDDGRVREIWERLGQFYASLSANSATDALSAFMAAIRALPNGPNCRGADRGSLPRIEFLRMRSQRVTPDEVFERHSCS
jgi:hypothetical protein